MKGLTVALALALVAAGGKCDLACGSLDEGSAEVPTVVVEQSEAFVRQVRAEGTLRAVEATPILTPQDQRRPMKVAWLAEDGSEVAEGEVVVRFDATEMERELADSKDDVASAERQIDKVRIESEAARRKREMTADLADLEAKVAKEFEAQDANIFSRKEIVEGTIDLELAESKAAHARKVKAVERSVSSKELELHEISQDQANREAERAAEGLAKLEVKAPHPGILVLARDWMGKTVQVGDTVWRGQKLAELPLVATMEAEVYVLEADAGSLAEGLPAEVVIAAHPETKHVAKVKRVDTLAQPRHPEVPVHYFGVTLELQTTDPAIMRVGQRVSATIRVEQPDALVVPRQAVFDRDGKTIVYKEVGGAFEAVEVKLGTSSAGRVVIEEGLEPGDRIALRDPNKGAEELLAGDSEGRSNEGAAAGGEGKGAK